MLRRQLATGDQNGISTNLRANITFRYTGLAHPGEWSDQQRFLPDATRIFQLDCDTCFNRVFPGEQLDDESAITGYDAILVAVKAIRSETSQQDSTASPTTGAVLQAMFRINRVQPVNGASGPIGFDDNGIPVDKPIPILQLGPDGGLTFTGLG